MFLHIACVVYLGDYRLRLTFDNGVVKDVNLADELYGEVFLPLRDVGLFRQVKVNDDTGTIEWPTGADLAPEYLYQMGHEVETAPRFAA